MCVWQECCCSVPVNAHYHIPSPSTSRQRNPHRRTQHERIAAAAPRTAALRRGGAQGRLAAVWPGPPLPRPRQPQPPASCPPRLAGGSGHIGRVARASQLVRPAGQRRGRCVRHTRVLRHCLPVRNTSRHVRLGIWRSCIFQLGGCKRELWNAARLARGRRRPGPPAFGHAQLAPCPTRGLLAADRPSPSLPLQASLPWGGIVRGGRGPHRGCAVLVDSGPNAAEESPVFVQCAVATGALFDVATA
jgi:hypothetical protein